MSELRITSNPFNRPPRLQDAFKPVDLDVPAPPSKPQEQKNNLLLTLLPVASFLVMGLVYSLISTGGGGSGLVFGLPMILMGGISVAISWMMYGEQREDARVQWIKQLREYHRQLDKKESRLLAGHELQMDFLMERCPSPDEIELRVRNLELNLWERRPEDPDFLLLRLGLGRVPSRVAIKPPDPDLPGLEIRRAFGLYTHYRHIPRAPVVINLADVSSLAVVGHRNRTMPFLYYLLSQVAVMHSPQDVQLFLLSSEQYYLSWKWLRWLPHASLEQTGGQPTNLSFGHESNRMMITSLSKVLDQRQPKKAQGADEPEANIGGPYHIILFDDEVSIRDEPAYNVLVSHGKERRAVALILCDRLEDVPSECQAVIQISDQNEFEYAKVGPEGIKFRGRPETSTLVQVDNLSHSLIPIALRTLTQASRIPNRINLLQVYNVERIGDLKIEAAWQRLPDKDGRLPFRVSIGSESLVNPLVLDLSENRDGPHGIIAGTTGSGKSELLQTLVAALAFEHHPYFVNFLLVDFKGGSTFGVFNNLPHTVGMISNLDKNSALRALDAIKAENLRRQAYLKRLGIEDISDYHRKLNQLGALPPNWVPLPHLFIIVDEFAQLAVDMPNFLPELVATVRVGRSLGLHLILATQRPAGVVSDEMRANLNFRISLRVQTIEDSRDMLRRPDAALLPHDLPGRAYFQLGDGGTPRQFQTARVGVDYEEASDEPKNELFVNRLDFERRHTLLAPDKQQKKAEAPSIAQKLVQEMQDIFQKQAQSAGLLTPDTILLPPLRLTIYLNDILESGVGWQAPLQNWLPVPQAEGLRVPVGRLDDLATRAQPLLWVDFSQKSSGGNLVILGAPGSGKTVFLRTLIYSLAHRYSPRDVNIYLISFAGRALEALKYDLPHVGDVIIGTETERLHRLLRLLESTIEERKVLLGNRQALDLESYNAQMPAEKRLPAICVMIDNFGELRNVNLADELDVFAKLIQDGRGYGVYFVLSAFQTSDIPYKISNLIEQRLALNLTDRDEYILFVGRPGSLEFDTLPPGRGFNSGNPPMQFQLAYPFDPVDDTPRPALSLAESPALPGTGSLRRPAAAPEEAETPPTPPAPPEAPVSPPQPPTLAGNFAQMRQTCAQNGIPVPSQIGVLKNRYNLSSLLEFDRGPQPPQPGAAIAAIVGEDDELLEPVYLNWSEDGPHLLIAGPSHSGRTSLLQAVALAAAARYSPEELMMVLVDGTNTSLRRLARLPHVLERVTDEKGLNQSLANLLAELEFRRDWMQTHHAGADLDEEPLCPFPRILFLMDDYDLTRDALGLNGEILATLGKHLRQDSNLGFHFILSSITHNITSNSDPLLLQMKLARVGISLGDTETLEILGGRVTSAMRGEELPEGRGYLVARSGSRLIQFAYPDPAAFSAVLDHWKGRLERAVWPHPATQAEVDAVEQESAPDFSADEKNTPAGSVAGGGEYLNLDELTRRYKELRQIEEQKKRNNP